MLLRNAELTERLRERVRRESAQAAELRASRQRVVLARDAARERLAREIQLAVCDTLEHAARTADHLSALLHAPVVDTSDHELTPQARELRELTGRIDGAIREFRGIVHGVFPPALTDHGLVAALENLVAELRRDTVLTVREGESRRAPARVESGIYFCVATLLRDLAAEPDSVPLEVEARLASGAIVVTVRDPAGAPVDPAVLEAVRDRAAALDGEFAGVGGAAPFTLRVPILDSLPATRDILPITQEVRP
jgi:signal transduction histidine kinase